MKRIYFLLIISLLASVSIAKQYDYTQVPGDKTGTRIYKLPNGLTVYLSVNNEKPRIQANIAVRTGSRNDPPETTGLAHYLEHLMFKGTKSFGTDNAQAEAPLLDTIEARFEHYRTVSDPVERRRLYHEIDSISQLAAVYNIPNEYDKLMASIGSEGSNAYTSNDVTCYVENIPANEVDNWARIQADRFRNMVIRGFHTELEAVYEEKNIGMGKDMWKMYEKLYELLFPNHPYGTQTTIGTQEHLKNPSITNIKRYFRNYYCPNNVAICMAGDLDPDATMATIDRYFGDWQPNETLSRPEYAPLKPLTSPVEGSVTGQEAEALMLAWRFDGASSLQLDTAGVVASLLANGRAGLFELNLEQKMRLLGAAAFIDDLHDYSSLIVHAMPKQGQSLDEVRALVLEQIDSLKQGRFADNLLTSVVNNIKRKEQAALESNQNRVREMVNAFINETDWAQNVGKLQRLEGITKEQIIDFARRHLTGGYVCLYKLQGEDTTTHKIDKPEITPIPTNRDKQSAFVAQVLNTRVEPIKPQFVDFSRDLTKTTLKTGVDVLYTPNRVNDLFTLCYLYDFGYNADKRINTAWSLMDYLGTEKLSVEQVKQQFYELACDISFSSSEDLTYVTLSGLSENMDKAVDIMEQLLHNARPDAKAYGEMVGRILKNRADAKTNQEACFNALVSYGIYGERKFDSFMSETELRNTDPVALIDLVKSLSGIKHTILYCGPLTVSELKTHLKKHHLTDKRLKDAPQGSRVPQLTTPVNEILLAPYEAKNIYMRQYHNENRGWHPEEQATRRVFNEYFGGGMNSIVFQELREARGLAYSAWAYYNAPDRKGDPETAVTNIISQNDKLMDCIAEFGSIIDTIPQSRNAFGLAKDAVTKRLESVRTMRMDILWAYLNAKRLGIDYDINRTTYEALPQLTLDDIVNFERDNMAGKPYRYMILGHEEDLDIKGLEQIAPIKRLTLEQIFGY